MIPELTSQDKTVVRMDPAEFRIALESKYHGTRNLFESFAVTDLDFFIMLSSVSGLMGSLGQSNYVAGSVYQDMFAHSRVSDGMTNFVTIDVPLIKGTYPISQDRIKSMARQGCGLVSVESLLPLVDYAMSGRAAQDGCNQITFGIDPQILLRDFVPPLFSKMAAITRGEKLAQTLGNVVKRTAEDSIAHATTPADAEKFILEAIQEKISSLIVVDSQDLPVDVKVTDLALDSLVAIEIRNWISNTLQAPVQTTDIMDSPSLRALSTLVSQRSALVTGAARDNPAAVTEAVLSDGTDLPKLPLPTLEATMEVYLESVGHLANQEEIQATRKAIASFLEPGSAGRRLQDLVAQRADEPNVHSWLEDVANEVMWLRERNWDHPRLHNFFHTHPMSKSPHSQAERATILSLAAYNHKLSIDDGTVKRHVFNDQPQCMESVNWLFNTNRTPAPGCDRVDRWPENDFVAVMRRGHLYKVPLRGHDGVTITHERLKAVFQAILRQPLPEVNWVTILTTDNRDEWAKVRSKTSYKYHTDKSRHETS